MYVLAVDTSTSYVIAGVVDISADSSGTPRTLAHRCEFNPRGHMEVLTPHIQASLLDAGLRPADIGAVVVGTGPGPFTGLRVGMATGAAFGEALSVPVHGVESHIAIACSVPETIPTDSEPEGILVVSDARRREWYWTVVDAVTATSIEGPMVTPPHELTEAKKYAHVLATRDVAAALPEQWHILNSDAHPTPVGLVIAALKKYGTAGLARPGQPLRALYLRRPDAVEPPKSQVSEALDFSRVDLSNGGKASVDVPVVSPLTVADAVACAEIEARVFAEDSPWSEAAFRSEISAAHTQYLGLFRGGEVVGFAGLALMGPPSAPEFEIHTIAISPEAQGRGWSKLLMDPFIDLAEREGGSIFLEVRTDNEPAVSLYRSYGFEVVATRKNYYQPSGADAFTMVRRVSPQPVREELTAVDAAGRPRIILGVETSCDETGVGIVELGEGGAVRQLSNRVASSMEQHARFGGVVPEIASRAHLEAFVPTMQAARADLAQAMNGRTRPDAVAATVGPGLAGALLVGAAAAKACAAAWEVPFYGVNHLGGHVAVDTLHGSDSSADDVPNDVEHAIALLVSGGHTQILEVRGVGRPMIELGSTLDDAAGEAYDKVARLLGLGYPGGPIIDRLAASGNPQAIAFPRGLSKSSDAPYDFSFSGVKTAVARYVEQAGRRGEVIPVEDLCASFQEAVVDVLTAKAVRACQDVGASVLVLGGGVSANRRLRELAAQRCAEVGVTLHVPPPALCTDNGVMIATLGAHLIAAGQPPSGVRVGTDPSMDVELPCAVGPAE